MCTVTKPTWRCAKPKIGGLEQLVTNLRNLSCSTSEKSLSTTSHSHRMTRWRLCDRWRGIGTECKSTTSAEGGEWERSGKTAA